MNENKTLYIVVPCYKEEAVLPETSKRLREKMHALMASGKIRRGRSSSGCTSRSRRCFPA